MRPNFSLQYGPFLRFLPCSVVWDGQFPISKRPILLTRLYNIHRHRHQIIASPWKALFGDMKTLNNFLFSTQLKMRSAWIPYFHSKKGLYRGSIWESLTSMIGKWTSISCPRIKDNLIWDLILSFLFPSQNKIMRIMMWIPRKVLLMKSTSRFSG